jgi:hypothetical protein
MNKTRRSREIAQIAEEARAKLNRTLRDIIEDAAESALTNYPEHFVNTIRAITAHAYSNDAALGARELSEMAEHVSLQEAPYYTRAAAAYKAFVSALDPL